MVQCHLCQPDVIIGVWSVYMQLVDNVSNVEETMLQQKENNAELIKVAKAQCSANDTITDKNCVLVEKVAYLRNEINHGNEIRAMNDKRSLRNFVGLGKSESGAY